MLTPEDLIELKSLRADARAARNAVDEMQAQHEAMRVAQAEFGDRLDDLERDMRNNTLELRANTEATHRVEKNTREIVDAMQAISWLAKPAKWVTIVTAAITGTWAVIYAFLHGSPK